MRLIFIGPPGAGKGTQSKLLTQRLKLTSIGMGDILRTAVQENTPAGRLAEPYVHAGHLVPDAVVNEIVAELFQSDDKPTDFIMDGYPRTLCQADNFERVLARASLPLDAVVILTIPDEEIVQRICGRWTCPNPDCKATFHVTLKPPKTKGICDECGSTLEQRDDDRPETIRERLRVFHRETEPLLDYYREHGLVAEVPGNGDFEKVYNDIIEAVNAKKQKRVAQQRG